MIDSQSIISSSINKPEKRSPNNQHELHHDRNEGIAVVKTQALHEYSRLNNMSDNKKHQMETVLNKINTEQRNDIQHVCISPKKRTIAKIYKCKSTDFKSFACVGEGSELGLCIKYLINKQKNEPLCIKKVTNLIFHNDNLKGIYDFLTYRNSY